MMRRAIFGVLCIASIAILVGRIIVDKNNPAFTNELATLRSLYRVDPLQEGCCVTGVRLGDGSFLHPDQRRIKDGYILSLEVAGTNYGIYATPEKQWTTGFRAFFTDRTGVIRHSMRSRATAQDPTLRELPGK
jgi:hypothetical protein